MAAHAKYGASDSAAWIGCPQFLKMKELLPDTESPYAKAGTCAHAIAEFKARAYFLEPLGKRAYNAKLKKLQADPAYEKDMDDATDLYLSTLKEYALAFKETPVVLLEQRVNYSEYAPGGFGTADCLMLGEGRLHVVDYKNGAGVPVSAEYNSQMMLYALGALQTLRLIYGDSIQDVTLTIVQPHAGGVKEWKTTTQYLREWGETVVKPAVKRAEEGTSPAVTGGHCRFCRGKAQCPARLKEVLSMEPMTAKEPKLLTPAEISDALTRGKRIAEWYKSLEDYALSAALAGTVFPGYKIVEGRSSRAWSDTDAAMQTLQDRGLDESMLYERKPVTVAGLEKIVGKKTFADNYADLVATSRGKPTLVEESDKRPAINAAELAFGGAVNG